MRDYIIPTVSLLVQMENQLMELDDISCALSAISNHTKLVRLILFIPCILLQSTDPPTNALNTTQFITISKTPTCFGTAVPYSGSLWTKNYKLNMFITKMWRYSNPCTGLDRPLGFQEVEAPRFRDNRLMKVVRLSALLTGRLYPPRKYSWYSFLLEAESTTGP